MKNKKYIIYNFVLIAILGIIIGAIIASLDNKNKDTSISIAEERITDDCIDEEIELENSYSEIITSSTELKLSPNAELVIEKNYTACGHTINEYAEILPEMVNKNQEEIENMYTNFKVQAFNNNRLVVSKEETGYCGEHYILKEKDGKVIVNSIDEEGRETLYETTSIPTQYLTQTDLINLKDGIKVYGKENLNGMIEDYE